MSSTPCAALSGSRVASSEKNLSFLLRLVAEFPYDAVYDSVC